MQGLAIRMARRLDRKLGRRGKLFAQRFRARGRGGDGLVIDHRLATAPAIAFDEAPAGVTDGAQAL